MSGGQGSKWMSLPKVHEKTAWIPHVFFSAKTAHLLIISLLNELGQDPR